MARLALPAFDDDAVHELSPVTLDDGLVLSLSVLSTLSAGLADGRTASLSSNTRGAVIALATNLLGLPLLAWVLTRVFDLGNAGLGLLVAAAAPGGSTGPLMASIAGGDPRAAARWFTGLTTIGGATAIAATVIVSPSSLALVSRAVVVVGLTSMAPLFAGRGFSRVRPALAACVAPWASRASLTILIATVLVLVARHGDRATLETLTTGAILSAVALGIAGLGVVDRATRIAVAHVTNVRNISLALVVLTTMRAQSEAISAVLAYGLTIYLCGGAAAIATRYARRQ